MRMTELLKSGIDLGEAQLKRSTSLSAQNNHFFTTMHNQILDHGGRVRMGSYAVEIHQRKVHHPVEESSSDSNA